MTGPRHRSSALLVSLPLLLAAPFASLAAQAPVTVGIAPQYATRVVTENAGASSGACQQFTSAAFTPAGTTAPGEFAWSISNPADFLVDTRTGLVCARQPRISTPVMTIVTATLAGTPLSGAAQFTVVPSGRISGVGHQPAAPTSATIAGEIARLERTTPPSVNAPRRDSTFTTVQIYYGTDRMGTNANDPAHRYGSDRGPLELGTAIVTIPRGHRPGRIESPSWRRLEFSFRLSRHITLLRVTPATATEWVRSFRATLSNSPAREAFVFVHGYNVSFSEAARRTAQLAYDLGYEGIPVLYSWPSQGTLTGYLADEATVERSAPYLRQFLQDLISQSGATRVHVIAHSMGNRVLASAIEGLSPAEYAAIGQVVLTAPDIDAEVFEEQVVPAMRQMGIRVTLYSSSADKALQASMKIHGYRRAGQSGDGIVVLPGLETVDASRVDTDLIGHGYFAEDKTVLDDLFLLLHLQLPATARKLRTLVKGVLTYWALQ